MCGIFLVVCSSSFPLSPLSPSSSPSSPSSPLHRPGGEDQAAFLQALQAQHVLRGPDSIVYHQVNSCGSSSDSGSTSNRSTIKDTLLFGGHVLGLRGLSPTPQPLVHPVSGNRLLWNGEVFGGHAAFASLPPDQNDTQALLQALEQADSDTVVDLAQVFLGIHGPWSMIYHETRSNHIYFGRDQLGRRSLLIHHEAPFFAIASVSSRSPDFHSPSTRGKWIELPADGIYRISVQSLLNQDHERIQDALCHPVYPYASSRKLFTLHASLPTLDTRLPENINRKKLPNEEDIDGIADAVASFMAVLADSVRVRIENIPKPPSIPTNQSSPNMARVAVLFSGGLDCMVLAAMAHSYLPEGESIDLLNVAFENPRSNAAMARTKTSTKMQGNDSNVHSSSSSTHIYNVPDRKTGLNGWKELCQLFPSRSWRFVGIDVPYAEACAVRERVMDLMYPVNTVMDYSIALAFWFAARGRGWASEGRDSQTTEDFTTTARVLLSGLGADEQLGGYSRHRGAYESGSAQALLDELTMDVNRLPTRNLARDDRVLSSHGKEARYPYLDERVVAFLCNLPVSLKMDFRFDRGVGDKMLLRMVARRLGLGRASLEAKRAIQFGARTAKMEEARSKGHHTIMDAAK